MATFTEIPAPFLASIATDAETVPTLYFSGNPAVRKFFWLRLRWLFQFAKRHARAHGSCLDFASGGGVFLPSLASLFSQVVAVDMETREAEKVVSHFGLENVTLVRDDVTEARLEQAPFDAIVAADVLEHFADLGPPVRAIRDWLGEDGVLLTSLPTENVLYGLLRTLFGVETAGVHHHTGHQVERFLASNGFRRVQRRFVPLRIRLLPLYIVSAWRKDRR